MRRCFHQFIQKINGIISLTGEKLHERQFIEAVRQAEKETNLPTKFFVGFADIEQSTYHFYYEFADTSIDQAKAEFDRKLANKGNAETSKIVAEALKQYIFELKKL